MNKYRLAKIERYIFEFFAERRKNKLLTKEVFDGSPQYANADLVRYTEEGDGWLQLTPAGVEYVGSDEFAIIEEPEAILHPPKSLTD